MKKRKYKIIRDGNCYKLYIKYFLFWYCLQKSAFPGSCLVDSLFLTYEEAFNAMMEDAKNIGVVSKKTVWKYSINSNGELCTE